MGAMPPHQGPQSDETKPLPLPPAGAAVSSREVLRGRQELMIDHGGAIYTLRVTRQGKLILTK